MLGDISCYLVVYNHMGHFPVMTFPNTKLILNQRTGVQNSFDCGNLIVC